jgi:predicted DNA-binding protein with PD1-like motif
MIKIRVNPGEEVIQIVQNRLELDNIRDGALTAIGAVDSCCISNMPRSDAKQDLLTEYNEPFEFSGTGEVRDGKPHIHCTLGREGDKALSGHLHWARVEAWYVHVFVYPL